MDIVKWLIVVVKADIEDAYSWRGACDKNYYL